MRLTQQSIQQGLLNSAIQCPSPNHDSRAVKNDISLIVLHSISLPPGIYGNRFVDDFFCNQLDPDTHEYFESIKNLKVSAHLLIRRDGSTTQYVNFNDRAWHAGASAFEGRENCNDFSIGIELEGLEGQTFEEAQYRSLVDIIGLLFIEYPKLNNKRICGHSDIAPGRKHDPGDGFDWHYFKKLLPSYD